MSQKLTEDDLDVLKDKALEYLPIVRQIMLSNSKYVPARGDSYWTELYFITSTQSIDRNTPKIQIAAIHLIQEISSFFLGLNTGFIPIIEDDCDLSDEDKELYLSMTPDELRDSSLNTVTKAARKFYDVEKKAIEAKIYTNINIENTTKKTITKKKPIIELRTAYIYELIKKKPYPPKEIPFTEKAVILIECTENGPKNLYFTKSTFNKAWTNGKKYFDIKDADLYRKRLPTDEE
jgi:hypothetical protein